MVTVSHIRTGRAAKKELELDAAVDEQYTPSHKNLLHPDGLGKRQWHLKSETDGLGLLHAIWLQTSPKDGTDQVILLSSLPPPNSSIAYSCLSLNMWPDKKANPIGTTEGNNDSNPMTLTIQLEEYPLPIVFPTELDDVTEEEKKAASSSETFLRGDKQVRRSLTLTLNYLNSFIFVTFNSGE